MKLLVFHLALLAVAQCSPTANRTDGAEEPDLCPDKKAATEVPNSEVVDADGKDAGMTVDEVVDADGNDTVETGEVSGDADTGCEFSGGLATCPDDTYVNLVQFEINDGARLYYHIIAGAEMADDSIYHYNLKWWHSFFVRLSTTVGFKKIDLYEYGGILAMLHPPIDEYQDHFLSSYYVCEDLQYCLGFVKVVLCFATNKDHAGSFIALSDQCPDDSDELDTFYVGLQGVRPDKKAATEVPNSEVVDADGKDAGMSIDEVVNADGNDTVETGKVSGDADASSPTGCEFSGGLASCPDDTYVNLVNFKGRGYHTKAGAEMADDSIYNINLKWLYSFFVRLSTTVGFKQIDLASADGMENLYPPSVHSGFEEAIQSSYYVCGDLQYCPGFVRFVLCEPNGDFNSGTFVALSDQCPDDSNELETFYAGLQGQRQE